MKTNFTALMLLLLMSCSKTQHEAIANDDAQVVILKYACGPSCDAQTWAIETKSGTYYEPLNLPDSFALYHLPVKLSFKKTGTYSKPGQGAGNELIQIVGISRR